MKAMFAIDAREEVGRAKVADPEKYAEIYNEIDMKMKEQIQKVVEESAEE